MTKEEQGIVEQIFQLSVTLLHSIDMEKTARARLLSELKKMPTETYCISLV